MRWFFPLFLALSGCATISNPTGGTKDVHAPKVVQMHPNNQTRSFQQQSFEIQFDEFFVLKSPQKNIIISPPIDPMPTFTVKGKTLKVNWNVPLVEKTTYNFFFAGAIADLNESNDTSFSYVISTGPIIDTLSVKCEVRDARTLKPTVEETWLLAYKGAFDKITTHKPDFISKVNDKGFGMLDYLPSDSLWLFALQDNNANFIYDHGVDRIAFLNNRISAKSDSIYNLNISLAEDTLTFLKSTHYKHPGKTLLVFNKELNPKDVFKPNTGFALAQKPNDSLIYYHQEQTIEQGKYPIIYTLDNKTDTTYYYVNKEQKEKYVKPFVVGGSDYNPEKPLLVKMPSAITTIDTTLIEVLLDSMPVKYIATIPELTPDFLAFKMPNKGNIFNLILKKEAITAAFGLISDSVSFLVKPKPKDAYARLTLRSITTNNGFLELIKDKKVIKTIEASQTKSVLPNLNPGNYTLRFVKDIDNNGIWTAGDFMNKRQPETVIYYSEVIELRAGWDEDIEWRITSK